MKRTGRKKEWSVALFCVSFLVLFPPVLSIFNKPVLVFGMPVAYVVLFGVWGLIILAVAYGARRRVDSDDKGISDSTSINDQGDP